MHGERANNHGKDTRGIQFWYVRHACLSFKALQVECLLDVIRDPAERQIVVECLVVISSKFIKQHLTLGISERNPEIRIQRGSLDILRIIRDAVCKYWEKWNEKRMLVTADKDDARDMSFDKNEKLARRMFFDLPQNEGEGSMFYLAQACVRLVFDVEWNGALMK